MAESPAWRRAFDGVERRISPPLETVTSSTEFQIAAQKLRRAKRAILRPVDGAASWLFHLAGLPSRGDVSGLLRQVGELQREVFSLRRELGAAPEEPEQ